ncbi:hypothetical protein ACWERV_23285 [Streptomyces sp. NPDC004031]
MPKESREAKRARKAAAKAAARSQAARIVTGEVPDYLARPFSHATPSPPAVRHKVVQTLPPPPVKALIPPSNSPLQPREREHYADNAPPVWVNDARPGQA